MDGEEQIGFPFVGDGGAAFERDERIVRARVDHLRAQALLDQFAEPQSDVQNQILLQQALRSAGALIVAAVSRVQHDAVEL